MKRFIEGQSRSQSTLFPQSLDEYIAEDNPVRAIDAFEEEVNLKELGFERAEPAETGRPGYDPVVMLKLYVYGYMNKLNTTRILERETHRNVELLWLTGWLMPDHKTIGEFRRKNGRAIRGVCAEFVGLCREWKLFEDVIVAIDGSKFKGVNSRDKNFTRASVKRRMRRLKRHIDKYLALMDEADAREGEVHRDTAEELAKKIDSMRAQMRRLKEIEAEVEAHPDKQVLLTDPDTRSMMRPGGGSVVGYNVQTGVEEKNHLIVTHEVTNRTTDRSQLSNMASEAKAAVSGEAEAPQEQDPESEEQAERFTVVADAGYYKGEEILECEKRGIRALVPKTDTSGKESKGEFTRSEFVFDPKNNEYLCPAGERLRYRSTREANGRTIHTYRTFKCPGCPLKAQCTTGDDRKIERWEHEAVLEAAAAEVKKHPELMRLRKQIAEHPYGTIKHWMGAQHFVMKRLPNVKTEMSLHVLAYNLTRVINMFGVQGLIMRLQAA